MASKKSSTPSASAKSKSELFGLDLSGWVRSSRKSATKSSTDHRPKGQAIYISTGEDAAQVVAGLGESWPEWQRERLLQKRGEPVCLPGVNGPIWLLIARPQDKTAGVTTSHSGLLAASAYADARDMAGLLAVQLQEYTLDELSMRFVGASDEEIFGALVGLEIGGYRFRQVRQGNGANAKPRLAFEGIKGATVEAAGALGVATNLARHLVNLPPSTLNPEAFADAVEELFKGSATTSVEVWSGKRLEKEGMGLLKAVGQAAQHGPRLVRLSYRPKGKSRLNRPLAFIGKGITFDSGGLDLKDASGMRLMKKDMGGAASVCGLAWWAEAVALDTAIDCYLALAENAIDQLSFKPGDILQARNGTTVEIDNTDAEGRLVLADAMDVALSQKGKDEPLALIDLATLTGAMRVGLGTRVAGLFANDDVLANQILAASQKRGDPTRRMPLYADYASNLKSVVADIANSGPGRFGGAITAALFLARFTRQAKWAHIDMYAWTEGGHGALAEAGGNGQCVQALASFLEGFEA